MRANEFTNSAGGMTISIPINITIPAGGGMPVVGTIAAPAGDEMPDQPVMVPPLQQKIEKYEKNISEAEEEQWAEELWERLIANCDEEVEKNKEY